MAANAVDVDLRLARSRNVLQLSTRGVVVQEPELILIREGRVVAVEADVYGASEARGRCDVVLNRRITQAEPGRWRRCSGARGHARLAGAGDVLERQRHGRRGLARGEINGCDRDIPA